MNSALGSPPSPTDWLSAHPDAGTAQAVAVAFLAAMEARDLTAAKAALAPGFTMVFPGPKRLTALEDLVSGSRQRYQWVAKRIEAVESLSSGGAEVVWVRGTLYGTNVHGVDFEGVRFVDRFEVDSRLLARQDVWNDLAESGVLLKTV